MVRWLLAAALLTTAGCGKKGSSSSGVGNASNPASFASSGFIDFDFDEEEEALEDLMGSELEVVNAECGNLLELEPLALSGMLSDPQIRCLEDRLKESERQTAKNKLSVVLMNDAWIKGDEHRWEGITRRHLEEIDRSNPDMCYKFAYILSKQGPDKAEEAMKWADVALDNRSRWEGETHVKRVYALHKIKTTSAQRKWEWLEEKYTKDPSEDLLKEKDESRNQAKTLAREWLEYARQANQDETIPYGLCVSASGTSDFCDEP